MDAIIETGHFKGDDLSTIGTCRKFKAVHMSSCIVRCDGREIRQDILDKHEGPSKRQLPKECPTAKMLETWNKAIDLLATKKVNGKMNLPNPLKNSTDPHFVTMNGMPAKTKLHSTIT